MLAPSPAERAKTLDELLPLETPCPRVGGCMATSPPTHPLPICALWLTASVAHPTTLVLVGKLHSSSSWVKLISSIRASPPKSGLKPWACFEQPLEPWPGSASAPQAHPRVLTGLNGHVPEKTLPAACEQPVSGGRFPGSQTRVVLWAFTVPFCATRSPCLARSAQTGSSSSSTALVSRSLPAPHAFSPGETLGRRRGLGQGTWATRQNRPVNAKGNLVRVGLTAVALV